MFVLWFVLTMDADMEKPIIFCKYYRLSERWYWIVRPSFKPWKRLTDEEKRMRELADEWTNAQNKRIFARTNEPFQPRTDGHIVQRMRNERLRGHNYKVLAVDEAVYVQQFGRALRSVGNLWVIDKNGNLTLNGDDNVQAE